METLKVVAIFALVIGTAFACHYLGLGWWMLW